MSKSNNMIPMVGTKWGRWLVIGPSARRDKAGSVYWVCRCACAKEREVSGTLLRRGASRSCGSCLTDAEKNRRRTRMTTHGMSYTATYRTWHTMRRRCFDKNFKDYPRYGGRGIQVCKRWLKFENFLEDMGERPAGMTLERKDVDGDYFKDNCIWADRTTQANNRRSNRFLTYAGKTMTLAQWAKYIGVPRARLSARVHGLGWPIGRALGYEGPKQWTRDTSA